MAKLTYTVHEAAEALGVSPNTVYEWVRRREIPFVRTGRERTGIKIPKVALLEWMRRLADEVEKPPVNWWKKEVIACGVKSAVPRAPGVSARTATGISSGGRKN